MHTNPAFRAPSRQTNLTAAGKIGFGTLILGGSEPLASHIPFLISGEKIEAHLTRANPILRAIRETPQKALLSVMGPDAYISPDWYGEPDQVPTWNYVAIHIRGTLSQADPASLPEHLARVSAHHEAGLAPKPPWTMDKMTEDTQTRMMRMILPVTLSIESVDGTWKLNQNKSDAARQSAAAALEDHPIADLMRTPPKT